MSGLAWTKEEDAELRRLAPMGMGSPGIAALLKRPSMGVTHRAYKLRVAIKGDPAARARAAAARREQGAEHLTAVLRSRWLGLIGPMKERLRAEVEYSAPTPRP